MKLVDSKCLKKISVIIITGNEEENIRDCLESIKWADETSPDLSGRVLRRGGLTKKRNYRHMN
jgi:hypothetical protein